MKITRFTSILFLFLYLHVGELFPQLAKESLPAFEVASIKPSEINKSSHTGVITYPGGRIDAGNCTLKMLIEAAYDIHGYQVTGGPKWIDTEPYDVHAIPPPSSNSSKIDFRPFTKALTDEQRDMIKALLRDRFSLSIRKEIKQGQILILEQNGKELGLREPADKNADPWAGGVDGGAIYAPTGISGQNISMPLFAQRLVRYFEKPVVDQTKLLGSYDFKIRLGDGDPDQEITASIISSLRGLGLRLRQDKGAVEGIVVEGAKKPLAD